MKFAVACFLIAVAVAATKAANGDDFLSDYGHDLAVSGSEMSPMALFPQPGFGGSFGGSFGQPSASPVGRLLNLLKLVRTIVRIVRRVFSARSFSDANDDMIEDTNDEDFFGPSQPSIGSSGLRRLFTLARPFIKMAIKIIFRFIVRPLGGGTLFGSEEANEGAYGAAASDHQSAYLYPGLMTH